jgi:hypothetical protein
MDTAIVAETEPVKPQHFAGAEMFDKQEPYKNRLVPQHWLRSQPIYPFRFCHFEDLILYFSTLGNRLIHLRL